MFLAGAQFRLGCPAQAQVGDAGGKPGEALLQLLPVEAQVLLGLGLAPQHVAAMRDLVGISGALDDGSPACCPARR